MTDGPSTLEIVWTALSVLLLLVCVWQSGLAFTDFEIKREQSKHQDGITNAAKQLAFHLWLTVMLDAVVVLMWTVAGALSVIRHYVEKNSIMGSDQTLAILLFIALVAFTGRVVVRALSRRAVNRL